MNFQEFYKRYPRRVKPLNAQKAYEKALRIATHDEIMAGLENFIRAEPWHGDIQFCPHPATWLNAGEWMNEYTEPVRVDNTTDRQKLSALLANDSWRDHWGPRPTREDAKQRLDAMQGQYEIINKPRLVG